MTDTDFLQPDLGLLRAAAEAAELAQAVSGLVSIDRSRPADNDPLAPLASRITRSMTEAGLPQNPPHNLLVLVWDRYGTSVGTQRAMTAAFGSVLRAFGYPVTPFGSGGARLVTGRRDDDPGAGR
jgi:hypothetical protein